MVDMSSLAWMGREAIKLIDYDKKEVSLRVFKKMRDIAQLARDCWEQGYKREHGKWQKQKQEMGVRLVSLLLRDGEREHGVYLDHFLICRSEKVRLGLRRGTSSVHLNLSDLPFHMNEKTIRNAGLVGQAVYVEPIGRDLRILKAKHWATVDRRVA